MKRGLIVFLLPLAGCSGVQSALDVHGQSALLLKDLIILFTVVCSLVWLAVIAVLIRALMRPRIREQVDDAGTDRRMHVVTLCAVAATVVIICGLTTASFVTTRDLALTGKSEVAIRVRGQQWWWQFIYEDADPLRVFQTANEIHIPVGRTVRVLLESSDVIHSFWVPSLAGKLDLIPGRENVLALRAERPGIYRGQCAEFCGLQHSHMAFTVIAEEEANYLEWAATQQTVAVEPREPEAVAGKAAFMRKQCSACHTVRGTEATGATGPDLTHIASRRTIGAGLLEMNRGSIAAWIADPQTLKPGNNMPLVPLSPEELRHISAYMESLR